MASTHDTPALEVRDLWKSFAGVTVLRGVDLDVGRGEIHGLIGPNGSGKSTLVKVLSGFHRPDGSPTLRVNGTALEAPFSVADVRRVGMGFVHQDLALVGDCSVADNLGFGAAGFAGGSGRIRWRRHFARVRELCARVGLDVDPGATVASLTPAERTLVAIARALGEFQDEALLVLDEPTASLPQEEVHRLFASLRRLAEGGTALVYISHRLPELLALTDRVTVLRDGRVVATRATVELSHDELAELMLGDIEQRRAEPAPDAESAGQRRELLRLSRFSAAGLEPVELALHEREILVLTGPVGCGAAQIGRALYGLTDVEGGHVEVDGVALDVSEPVNAKRLGIAYLPSDRQGLASFQDLTVAENILATDWSSLATAGRLSDRTARREAARLIVELNVEPPDPDRIFRTLSGGNQQKALIAKWLRLSPRVLVVDEPTQGIDIRTRGEIYARLRAEADAGLAVLWITSDLEEASVIGDRVMVFVAGRHEGTLEGDLATPDAIGRLSLAAARA
jgi:ribose transport system ATP-binding protein